MDILSKELRGVAGNLPLDFHLQSSTKQNMSLLNVLTFSMVICIFSAGVISTSFEDPPSDSTTQLHLTPQKTESQSHSNDTDEEGDGTGGAIGGGQVEEDSGTTAGMTASKPGASASVGLAINPDGSFSLSSALSRTRELGTLDGNSGIKRVFSESLGVGQAEDRGSGGKFSGVVHSRAEGRTSSGGFAGLSSSAGGASSWAFAGSSRTDEGENSDDDLERLAEKRLRDTKVNRKF